MGCSGSNHAQNPSKGDPLAVPKTVEIGKTSSDPGISHSSPAGKDKEDSTPLPSHGQSAPQIHHEGATVASPTAPSKGARVDANGRRIKSSHSVPANFFKGATHNGFKIMPEAPSIRCTASGLAAHSLPAEALVFDPSDECVISRFKNGDQERKIHCNIRLSDVEIDRLQGMRGEARAQGVDFFPSVTSMATRFLSRARMDAKKAVHLMRETQDWRASFFKNGPIEEKEVKDDMKHGICYFCGRDHALRPVIVIRPARIPPAWYKEKRIDKFIRLLIFSMEYFLRYMVVPGRVENLSVIVDMKGLGISQVPLGALGDVYKVMSHHYIGRVFKFYVCNVSTTLSTIGGMARSFLTDRQKQKLNMLDDVKELQKEFALTQLEQDLGGNRSSLKQFYPFPMRPGPFTPGYSGQVEDGAVPNVHEVLSQAGAMGRLWDPKLSDDDNLRLDYSNKAVEILKSCNLPVPPSLLLAMNTSTENEELIDGIGLGEEITDEVSEAEVDGIDNTDPGVDEARISVDPQIESTTICGQGAFCCRL